MEKNKVMHLEKPNTLSDFLAKEERESIVSLKISGFIGLKDFDDVFDDMCTAIGMFDEFDNFIPDFENTPALRNLDLGDATYVDGDVLPYFGYHAQLNTFVLPQGVKSTTYGLETETGFNETDMLKTLVFPKGIKSVGGFNSCTNLTGLVFPDSLEEIKSFAFCDCKKITSIRIPASVKILDGSCFAGCNIERYEIDENNPYFISVDGVVYTKDLTTLVAFPSAYPHKNYSILEKTKTIGDSAFMYSQIESIILSDGLVAIKDRAFNGSSICCIEMPDSVKEVGKLSFECCFQLEHIRLSNSLAILPRQLFSSCPKLKVLDVPPNIKSVSYSALALCEGLERLIFHDGLEEIVDEGPLLGCYGKLQEVVLPRTLRKVPGGVFNYSPFIKDFKLNPDNPYFCVIDGALFSKDGKILYSVPDYNLTSYCVPEGVEVIAERVFAFLPKLHTVELPSSLKIIKSRVFQNCESLCRIEIPANVEQVDFDALWGNKLKTIIMKGAAPPEMTGLLRDDDGIYRDVELYVPHEAVTVYKKAPGWKCFFVKESKDC